MPKVLPIAASALVLALSACNQQAAAPAVDTAKIANEVKAQTAGLITAFNGHNAEMAVSYDAEDYIGMFHGMPNVAGKAADLEVTKKQVADPAAKVAVSGEDVSVATGGDRALYRATYAFTFTDPKTKKVGTENGNWLIGWRKQQDGSWKIAWSVVSDTGAAPAKPAA